ncbi:MAG: hypothetical protein M8866_02185 [marine benthic group bacterium]|jgi:hypothetical protein|nr:hypothetical protein [Candidatus Benthicola marisminoris]
MSQQVAEDGAIGRGFSVMHAGMGVAGVAAVLGGIGMLETGLTIGIEAGVLLLVAGLGLLAVGVGGQSYGPRVEGVLDLSSRLGLGLLGGVLAGLLHGLLTEVAGGVGLTLLMGVGVDVDLSASQYLVRALYGSVWGLALGVLYPVVPGNGMVGKGFVFSLFPSLYTLLVVYPVFLGLGFFGVRQGLLTFVLVIAGNGLVGILAAGVISWGGETDLAPVSDHLVR